MSYVAVTVVDSAVLFNEKVGALQLTWSGKDVRRAEMRDAAPSNSTGREIVAVMVKTLPVKQCIQKGQVYDY